MKLKINSTAWGALSNIISYTLFQLNMNKVLYNRLLFMLLIIRPSKKPLFAEQSAVCFTNFGYSTIRVWNGQSETLRDCETLQFMFKTPRPRLNLYGIRVRDLTGKRSEPETQKASKKI